VATVPAGSGSVRGVAYSSSTIFGLVRSIPSSPGLLGTVGNPRYSHWSLAPSYAARRTTAVLECAGGRHSFFGRSGLLRIGKLRRDYLQVWGPWTLDMWAWRSWASEIWRYPEWRALMVVVIFSGIVVLARALGLL